CNVIEALNHLRLSSRSSAHSVVQPTETPAAAAPQANPTRFSHPVAVAGLQPAPPRPTVFAIWRPSGRGSGSPAPRPPRTPPVPAERVRALGHEAVAAPLLAVMSIEGVRVDLAGVAALAFTSANGVRAFSDATGERGLKVFAVGAATAQAARAAGFKTVLSA